MPKATSATPATRTATVRPTTTKAQRIAATSDVLWRTIFGTAEPSTHLGRVIACDAAAARLAELGLLDLTPRETP